MTQRRWFHLLATVMDIAFIVTFSSEMTDRKRQTETSWFAIITMSLNSDPKETCAKT